jgi:hypothetical protein
VLGIVGDLNDRREKRQAAYDAYRLSAAEYEFLVTEFTANTVYRYQFAEVLVPLGIDAGILGHVEEAKRNLERAGTELDEVLRAQPGNKSAKLLKDRVTQILAQVTKTPKPEKKQ